MSDLHNILQKFNQLGIKNEGLTADVPQVQAPANESAGTGTDVNTNTHARTVNESVRGKHIPGITDVSSNDLAALAGVKVSNTPKQPSSSSTNTMYADPIVQQPTNSNIDYNDIGTRLDNIEAKLQKIFEAILPEEKPADKIKRHTLDLDDLERQIRKSGTMDKDFEDALKARRLKIQKDKEQKLAAGMRETTSESTSLFKDYLAFLEEKN